MKVFSLLVLALTLTACSVVGPGERGVRVSMGSVSDESLAPGPHFWLPGFYGLDTINIQIQKVDIESTAASKDMQDVHAKIAINWSLASDNVVRTYKEIGNEEAVATRILQPAANEVMKAATAKRTAEEVLTKRLEMKLDIDNGLKARLANYGITLHDVSIVSLKFSGAFSDAIEQKQVAEQKAKQAGYDAERATQEAKAAVERAKGQAEAQRLVQSSTTPAILQQEAIKKWDGKFPQVMGGQALPFINLDKK